MCDFRHPAHFYFIFPLLVAVAAATQPFRMIMELKIPQSKACRDVYTLISAQHAHVHEPSFAGTQATD